MKKAGLIKVKPLMATDNMIQQARSDLGEQKIIHRSYGPDTRYTEYKTFLFFRARKQGAILEICLYTRADLVRRDRVPRYRIFLDRDGESHATYECAEGKWRTGKIDSLPCGSRIYYVPDPKPVVSESTKKLINEYCRTGRLMDVKEAILDFQSACAGKRLKKKYKLETDQIDYMMNMVPELPKDFDKFIEDYGCYHAQYIFYKDKSIGYCTHCGRVVPIKEKPSHNMPGKCSHCGSSITYKSWNKQKYCDTEHTVSIIQKCADGETYIYRQFEVRRRVHRENLYIPEKTVHEEYRVIMDNNMRSRYEYEFGEYRHTGVRRWCNAGSIQHGYYYSYSLYGSSVLYHGNLKKLLNETKLKYIPVAEIIKSNPGRKFNVCATLNDMCNGNRFPFEAYWKMGLRKFAADHMYAGQRLTKISYEYKKPWEILKITKEILNQAIKLNASDQQMRILQRAHEVGVRLTDEQVKWLDTYMGVSDIMAYFRVQTPHRIIRYLKEQVNVYVPRKQQTTQSDERLRLYIDYLDTARQLGWDMRDRGIFFPQDITRAHDEAVQLFNAQKDEREASKMKDKDKKLRAIVKDVRKVFDYEDEEYKLFVPECFKEFKAEGNAQHNCVASSYYDRAVRGEVIILFIRKKTEQDKSFCTVEIQNRHGEFVIAQNRIIYNANAPKEAQEFMTKAVEEAQKKVERLMKEQREAEPQQIRCRALAAV